MQSYNAYCSQNEHSDSTTHFFAVIESLTPKHVGWWLLEAPHISRYIGCPLTSKHGSTLALLANSGLRKCGVCRILPVLDSPFPSLASCGCILGL